MHKKLGKKKPKEEKFRKTAKRSKGTSSFLKEMRKQARKNKKKGKKKDPFSVEIYAMDNKGEKFVVETEVVD